MTSTAPALERHHGMCDWDRDMFVWGRSDSIKNTQSISVGVLFSLLQPYNTFVRTFQSHVSVACGTAAMLKEVDG